MTSNLMCLEQLPKTISIVFKNLNAYHTSWERYARTDPPHGVGIDLWLEDNNKVVVKNGLTVRTMKAKNGVNVRVPGLTLEDRAILIQFSHETIDELGSD